MLQSGELRCGNPMQPVGGSGAGVTVAQGNCQENQEIGAGSGESATVAPVAPGFPLVYLKHDYQQPGEILWKGNGQGCGGKRKTSAGFVDKRKKSLHYPPPQVFLTV